MQKLFITNQSFAPLLARVALAVVMFPHGAQKVLGWWGGHGYPTTVQMFTEKMQLPMPLALAAIWTEFIGPILLVLGLFTRFTALAFAILISVAAYKVHWANGFFMNWSGKQAGEGFEYHILFLALSLVLLIQGGGKFSMDSFIAFGTRAKRKSD
jgi:putative oxidoreductase